MSPCSAWEGGGRDEGKSETNESGSMFALSSKKCPTFPRGGKGGGTESLPGYMICIKTDISGQRRDIVKNCPSVICTYKL